MMSKLMWILGAVAIGYGAIALFLYLFQSKMVYHPVGELFYTPSSIGLEYEDIFFETADSVRLHGWFVPSKTGSTKGTVLFSHGNAGNISGRLETIRLLHDLSLNVLIYDYRGYGRSEGSPSEEGTYEDARAAWNYLVDEREIAPQKIIVMGRSLGGAVSAWLAARVNPAGLILESTFTSAGDLGADLYPIFPVRLLTRFEYATSEHLKKIDLPILIAHSKEDEIVPYHHGRELYRLASDPKTFLELQGPHGGGFIQTGKRYREAVKTFVDEIIIKE